MDQPDPMLALAQAKITGLDGGAPPDVVDAATRLLVDLYRAGMKHGVSPDDWSFVASLGNECLDATRQAVRRRELAWERSADLARPAASIEPIWPPL